MERYAGVFVCSGVCVGWMRGVTVKERLGKCGVRWRKMKINKGWVVWGGINSFGDK